tara:strand:- start:16 stop:207 length:192 start_codon:yes stop_codon:yes gene_type:complete
MLQPVVLTFLGEPSTSKPMKNKATEDQFNELHNLVTKEFLARVKSGEALINQNLYDLIPYRRS